MISQSAIQTILGIQEKVHMKPEDMVKQFKVSFYPGRARASENVSRFAERLQDSFHRLGVDIVPYDSIYERRPFLRRSNRFFRFIFSNIVWIFRKGLGMSEVNSYIPVDSIFRLSGSRRIKKGISVVCIGEQETKDLAMQYISNFKDNSIITILDFPDGIDQSSDFKSHFDVAMKLFALHMTNLVVAVSDSQWMLYNFNASHPIYLLDDGKFDEHVLKALIPKIVAPISPHKLEEFNIISEHFDPLDASHAMVIDEMRKGARLFDGTQLYPKGKKIDELPFRHPFHKLIGKIHLDNRNGMSFGYLAFQMPQTLSKLISYDEFISERGDVFKGSDIFCDDASRSLYLSFVLRGNRFVMKVPDVWVMTIRSGADKTHFDPETDLLKIGLMDGRMMMQLPKGLKIHKDYKPSFDTKVILAHAVGNAMIGSILQHFGEEHGFVSNLVNRGLSLSHWHGYFNRELLPRGIDVYGRDNLHVSCSSPQSAIYALDGKLDSFFAKIEANAFSGYRGDVHVEPHHGINITFPSLIDLAEYILANPEATVLGNKYL